MAAKFPKFILVVFTLLTSFCYQIASANQTVYQWKDSNGVVHFSDQPHSGAKKLEISEPEVYHTPELNQFQDETLTPPPPSKNQPVNFKSIIITSPRHESTHKNNQGSMTVSVATDPQLKKGYKVKLLFDGKSAGQPQTDLTFTLKNIFRGSHTLSASIIDPEGKTILSSKTITIFMQRPFVNQNPNYNKKKFFP